MKSSPSSTRKASAARSAAGVSRVVALLSGTVRACLDFPLGPGACYRNGSAEGRLYRAAVRYPLREIR